MLRDGKFRTISPSQLAIAVGLSVSARCCLTEVVDEPPPPPPAVVRSTIIDAVSSRRVFDPRLDVDALKPTSNVVLSLLPDESTDDNGRRLSLHSPLVVKE